MARKRNHRKIPEVLWRIYGNRARTLEETVIDLLPKPLLSSSDKCRCRGKGCLGCSGSDPKGFLLRRSDPKDYFNLLTNGFAVVSNAAPSVQSFSFDIHWTQEQVVEKTIERIIGNNQNVICNGYKLHQARDEVMVHLFKFVSLFLPLAGGNHYQVSGYSINGLCPKFSKKAPVSTHQHHLSHPSGNQVNDFHSTF
ncbi:Telomerase reverse transcriptase [Thalictrum thalictroides]|uniref:Telomerase reverse transcriptase n=1 Tax=Thalictrum thalictroides TaxID=46969 RepID=A0A7J6VS77_THATH|nr:Telomerase reverse transcriptase [Thalictrum thalictroides]